MTIPVLQLGVLTGRRSADYVSVLCLVRARATPAASTHCLSSAVGLFSLVPPSLCYRRWKCVERCACAAGSSKWAIMKWNI